MSLMPTIPTSIPWAGPRPVAASVPWSSGTRRRSLAVIAALLAVPAGAADSGGPLRIDVGRADIRILAGERPILSYAIEAPPCPPGIDEACARSGILHPVCTPHGTVVTAAFPRDHPHQSGIFTAWTNALHDGRRVDFWNLAKRQGRVLHAAVRSTFTADDAVGFEVDLLHRVEAPVVLDVLRESWRVTVRPTDGSFHCFDLDSVQRAIPPASLTLAKYHYGGLAVRGPEAWLLPDDADMKQVPGPPPAGGTLVNSRGQERIEGNLADTRWVAMASRPPAAAACIVAMQHPSSFRAPQPARLHPTKPYFCFAPSAAGEFVIDESSPYVARYRFLVTDGGVDRDWIESRWREWVGPADESGPPASRDR